jgi:hypothetical protein
LVKILYNVKVVRVLLLSERNMKKFRFKYSLTVWLLLALVVALSLGGLAWNVFNIIQYVWAGAFKITIYALIVAITAFLAIFASSVMIFGFYVVKNGQLYTQFGFISSKVKISDIVQITHFKKSDKLVAYFTDQKYTVIVIAPQDYDEFIKTLREINPQITYNAEIDGEDTPN